MSRKLYDNTETLEEVLELLANKAAGGGGTDTSDATATSADILIDKTAYANGKKITGSIPLQSAKTITPSASEQVAISSGYYASGDVKVQGDANLTAENIKKGATIFGVEGNYEGGGEKPTLFTPSISLQSVTSVLTITDDRNGDFVEGYNLFANDNLITVSTSKEVTLNEYIEHTETIDIKVQAVGAKFNPSDYAVVEWKYVNVNGTAGLAYSIVTTSGYARCYGMGDCIETDIEIASMYEGFPVTHITERAFSGNTTLTSIVIPDSITNIGNFAFSSCTNVTRLVIGDGLKSIGNQVFGTLKSLTSVEIGNGVTSIGQASFAICESLTSISFPNNISSIGKQAFQYCSNLKRVDLSNNTKVPTLADVNAFGSTHTSLQIIVPSNLLDEWKAATNWSNYADKIVAAPPKPTEGLAYSLSSDGTMAMCNGIGTATETDIVIASEYEGVPVTKTTAYAFQYSSNLTSVVIPDSVTLIDINSFKFCSGLTTVEIQGNLSKIGNSAFGNCSSLKRVDFSNHTSIPTLGSFVFTDTHADLQIKVPANLIDEWKAATNWANLADKIVTEFTNTL